MANAKTEGSGSLISIDEVRAELQRLKETARVREWSEEMDELLLEARSGPKKVTYVNIATLFKRMGYPIHPSSIKDRYNSLLRQRGEA